MPPTDPDKKNTLKAAVLDHAAAAYRARCLDEAVNLHSPFRYPGGKFYGRRHIIPKLPPHVKYCELFCGGASIFFAKPLVPFNHLNDLDGELMNCYRFIRDHVEMLIGQVKHLKATKENHGFYKALEPRDALERAQRWYFLNRVSYSGIMKMQNCYWGYGEKYSMTPERWGDHLRKTSAKLQGVKLTCEDFRGTILAAERDTFMFIDPPYYGADQDKFYTCSFTKKDHEDLYKILLQREHEIKFFLTYDNRWEVHKLYEGWCNVRPVEWGYTIQRTDDQRNDRKLADGHQGRRKKGKELFITNYELGDDNG
jgi:DNA adenine methylase